MTNQAVILLVEDDPNDAFFVSRALSKLGFEGRLEHCSDTDSAKRYLAGQGPFSNRDEFPVPRMIIADSAMSVRESGIELLEWMRDQKPLERIPFVILSGGVTDETRARAEAAGARQILAKVSNYNDLVPRLRDLLDECRPASQL